MKSKFIPLIVVLVLGTLLCYMFFFQVRYDEVALRTRLGAADAGSICKPHPWPFFKIPVYHSVYKFPARVQIMEDQAEEMQTADAYAIIPRTYVAWRIEDPLAFYTSVKTVAEAEKRIQPMIRELRKVIAQYRFDELVNTDPARIQIVQMEQKGLEAIRQQIQNAKLGIAVEHFGVRRMVLPEQVTGKVFDRMRQTRQTMAENARSEGKNQAATIRSEAESIRRIILAFAENRAQAIRTQGMSEAAEYYKAFKEDEDLAIFMRQIDTLKKILPHNSTYILDANQLGIRDMFQGSASDKAVEKK